MTSKPWASRRNCRNCRGVPLKGISNQVFVVVEEDMSSVLDRFIAAPSGSEPTGQPATAATVATVEVFHGYTAAELEAIMDPWEWSELGGSREALAAFARLLQESHQTETGERPERFDRVAMCRKCGPVWVPSFLEGQSLAGCRWCARRRKGLPIPRPHP